MRETVCAIVGARPGNGAAFARRFAAEGRRVVLLARDADRLQTLAETVAASAVPSDITDEVCVKAAFARVAAEHGPVGTPVYNAGNYVPGSVADTPVAVLEAALQVNCSGLLASVQQVLPAMLERGSGSVVAIGATAARRGVASALPLRPRSADNGPSPSPWRGPSAHGGSTSHMS